MLAQAQQIKGDQACQGNIVKNKAYKQHSVQYPGQPLQAVGFQHRGQKELEQQIDQPQGKMKDRQL